MQLNFGVVLNESMGDSVKITVIATGFNHQPAAPKAFELPEPEPVVAPAPPPPPPIVSAPEPQPSLGDDVDTPAILRRGKLLF